MPPARCAALRDSVAGVATSSAASGLDRKPAHGSLRTAAPIVSGIDGSKAAIRAVIWAPDEAVTGDTNLRLVHVIDDNARTRELNRDNAVKHLGASAVVDWR